MDAPGGVSPHRVSLDTPRGVSLLVLLSPAVTSCPACLRVKR